MTKKNNPRKLKIKRRAARKAAGKRRAAPDMSGIFRRPTDPGATEYTGPITFLKVYLRQLRRHLMTGMLVWVPLIVTMWVLWWLIKTVGFNLERFIERMVGQINVLGERTEALSFLQSFNYTPGLGFLLAILLFLTTGFLTRYLVARRFIASGEQLLIKIPFISRVYLASQQIRDVFVRRDGAVFQQVVLLEYPRPGIVAVGFVTSTEQGVVQQTADLELTAVFVPTTPNPTSGFLLYIPPEDLTELDIGVEDAVKLIISGGAFIPGAKVSEEPLGNLPAVED